MKPSSSHVSELKRILEQISAPDRLDDHPWARSLVVRQGVEEDASLREKSPGYRLVKSLSGLFRQMMPSMPPKRGKRLDTRWCQFGMLAAEYFVPFEYGTAYPSSLRDAWGRMDTAIAWFVFGKAAFESASDAELTRYRLFDDEEEPAPTSTLSDWHTKGLERLAELFLDAEQYLSHQRAQPSIVLEPAEAGLLEESAEDALPERQGLRSRILNSPYLRYIRPALIVLALVFVVWLGVKGWRVYQGARAVRADMTEIQGLAVGQLSMDMVEKVGPLLSKSRQDVAGLKAEVGPFLWLGKGFGWLPVYGGDLASAQAILEMADGLTIAADEAFQGAAPLVLALQGEGGNRDLVEVTKMLVEAQPAFVQAKSHLDEAMAARSEIDVQRLDPKVRVLIVDKLDPYLGLFHDGLALAVIFPRLVGASSYGPQTYLLLLQNEDELRATGGFITSAGTFVVKDGDILNFVIEDSYAFDDPTRHYPSAPWQLQQYMELPTVLLRDANWSPDFPTSAAQAEYLYALTRFHGADGVVAIDQYAVKSLLTVLGPVQVEAVSYPITAENVVAFMRQAKGQAEASGENRKSFMNELGGAILDKIKTSKDIPWMNLVKVLQADLNAHHMLLQFDDTGMAAMLAERGWDGALRSDEGDFLMVVDSNVGFNKVNAVVEESLTYDVDLSDPVAPKGTLTVLQTNHATQGVPCKQFDMHYQGSYENLVNRCYWDYLRVYKPLGTQYLEGTPHEVPGLWMVSGTAVPARVDMLDDKIEGVQGFGTLLVVPGGDSLETSFRFQLPSQVIGTGEGSRTKVYHLRVQKQAGTLPQVMTVRINLPSGAKLLISSPEAKMEADGLSFIIDFQGDVEIEITYQVP
jgi:hypothetical protein